MTLQSRVDEMKKGEIMAPANTEMGTYGPDGGWTAAYPECKEKNQSPINVVDADTRVSMEYQELTLDGFETESSNKTSMKNTGKTVAVLLKDDYYVRGAGLPGRFKAEKVEFHWGQSNGSEGSEHSINGHRFPVEAVLLRLLGSLVNEDPLESVLATVSPPCLFKVLSKVRPTAFAHAGLTVARPGEKKRSYG
ncbi:hypothetical protein ACEWY4_013681 [Coilia grayii]|uniref:Alpha-carbonic anhydrase domain-containing protein n=1 Tax=Coilia grayii TaxID=363190 RepID=A0ABD1JX24_9TELE